MFITNTKKSIFIVLSLSPLLINSAYAVLPQPYLDVCGGLNGRQDLSAIQQNFVDICGNIGRLADDADNTAVAALRHEEVAAQGTAALESSRTHSANVTQRINVLRQSISTGVVIGGGAGDENELLEDSRWGFFANGGFNSGDKDQTVGVSGDQALGDASTTVVQGERSLDFDGQDFSMGVDYRFPGEKIIVGAALGYSEQRTEFRNQAGETDVDGYHISVYGTYLPSEKIYIDGIISVGKNDIKASRPVPVLDNGVLINDDGRAFADTDGQQLSTSIGAGYEVSRNAWNITSYTRFDYTNTDIDAYDETVQDNDTLATGRSSIGMAISVDKQKIYSLLGVLGVRVSYPISAANGVFVPQASLEFNRQFRNDERFIDAGLQLPDSTDVVSAQTSELDRNYGRIGLGVSALFPNGHSGFVQLESLLANDDISDTAIKLGYRVEF